MGSRQKHLQSGVYLVSRRSVLLTSKLEHGPGGGGKVNKRGFRRPSDTASRRIAVARWQTRHQHIYIALYAQPAGN